MKQKIVELDDGQILVFNGMPKTDFTLTEKEFDSINDATKAVINDFNQTDQEAAVLFLNKKKFDLLSTASQKLIEGNLPKLVGGIGPAQVLTGVIVFVGTVLNNGVAEDGIAGYVIEKGGLFDKEIRKSEGRRFAELLAINEDQMPEGAAYAVTCEQMGVSIDDGWDLLAKDSKPAKKKNVVVNQLDDSANIKMLRKIHERKNQKAYY